MTDTITILQPLDGDLSDEHVQGLIGMRADLVDSEDHDISRGGGRIVSAERGEGGVLVTIDRAPRELTASMLMSALRKAGIHAGDCPAAVENALGVASSPLGLLFARDPRCGCWVKHPEGFTS